jgi:deazaflavin-dependent oxidoreductase (nitroreductase family)
MRAAGTRFQKSGAIERLFNRSWGALVGAGIGLPHSFVLDVRGRRSGRVHSTPVNLLVHDGRSFLVAPRGATEWVRNARARGEVALRKGGSCTRHRLRELRDDEKPEVLKAYLDRFATTVQRYFPVRAESSAGQLARVADRYPVFEATAVP